MRYRGISGENNAHRFEWTAGFGAEAGMRGG
jgi:hypothetical protein